MSMAEKLEIERKELRPTFSAIVRWSNLLRKIRMKRSGAWLDLYTVGTRSHAEAGSE